MKYILEERFILREAEEASSKEAEETSNKEVKADNSQKVNWDNLYKKCKSKEDFEIFWHGNGLTNEEDPIKRYGYFLNAFGHDNGKYVAGLGAKFMEYLTELGFTAAENIFVKFIMRMIEAPIGTARISQLNRLNFPVIIEAHDSKQLTDSDLLTGGKLGKYNLIFNANFYAANSADEYLNIQSEFIKSSKIKGDLGLAFANYYSVSGKPSKPNTSVPVGDKLVPISKLKTLVSKLTGRSEADDKTVEKVISSVTNTDIAKARIAYAYDAFSLLMPEAIVAADQQANNAITAARKAVNLSQTMAIEGRKLFGLPNTAYKQEQVVKILLSLAKTAGFYAPKE